MTNDGLCSNLLEIYICSCSVKNFALKEVIFYHLQDPNQSATQRICGVITRNRRKWQIMCSRGDITVQGIKWRMDSVP